MIIKSEHKIGIIELIKESFKFLWKYKFLIIFGFIIALFASGSRVGRNTSDYSDSSNSTALSSFISSISVEQWILIIVVSLLFIAIGWYLSSVSAISIFRAVKYDKQGRRDMLVFKKLFVDANNLSVLLKFFLFDISIFFIVLILVLVPILGLAILITLTAGPGAIIIPFICCFALFIIPVFVFAFWVVDTTKVLMANYEMDLMDALNEAYDIVKREWINYLLLSLANIVIYLGFVPLFIIMSLVDMALLLPAIFLLSESITASSIGLLILAIFVIDILSATVMSVLYAYYAVSFSKFVHNFKGEYTA